MQNIMNDPWNFSFLIIHDETTQIKPNAILFKEKIKLSFWKILFFIYDSQLLAAYYIVQHSIPKEEIYKVFKCYCVSKLEIWNGFGMCLPTVHLPT